MTYIISIVFCKQLGILNVVEAMELAPELAYPLYMAACADWYLTVTLLFYYSLLKYPFVFCIFLYIQLCALF